MTPLTVLAFQSSNDFLFVRVLNHRPLVSSCVLLLAISGTARAELPDDAGKATLVRVCGRCHSPEQAASLHQDRLGWEDTMTKMIKFGAQGSDDEFEAILGYLTKHYGAQAPGPINMNQANMVDLETGLLLRRSEARAVIQQRSKDGPFKSINDLRNIPGVDFRKIESKQNRLVF